MPRPEPPGPRRSASRSCGSFLRHRSLSHPSLSHPSVGDPNLSDTWTDRHSVGGSRLHGFHCLRLTLQPRCATGALRGRNATQVFQLVQNFLTAAKFPLQLPFPTASPAYFQNYRVSGIHTRQSLPQLLPDGLPLYFKDRVSSLQSSSLRLADRGDCGHRHRTIKIAGGRKARVRLGTQTLDGAQAHSAEEIIPRNFLCSRNIIREEPSQIRMTYRFGGFTHTVGIFEVASLLGVVFVHPLQHLTQRCLPVAGVSYRQVQHDAQQLALVVIRNAAHRTAIVSVAFEPGVEAP